MGLMDTLTGLLKSSGVQDKLIKSVQGMVGDGSLSLDKFKERADQAGLGHIVDSWIGKGENKPITADQVKQTADPQNLQRMADEAGVSVDEAAEQLSKALPQVVDHMTPDGVLPSAKGATTAPATPA
jgi:uncharacterized protein YidB (DUF937 family)